MPQVCENVGFLFFWKSRCCAVIGKNQNPWREVRVPRLADENCALARRVSGGGTVFHDAGNLNVSFILPRASYERAAVFAVFQQALAKLGIPTHFLGPTNLGVQGRKVSGHAFAFRGNAVLHHATLLINTDLARMARILRRDSAMKTHAIASQPADVANLSEFARELSEDAITSAICSAAGGILGYSVAWLDSLPETVAAAIDERNAALSSWDWVYGHTPDFEIHMSTDQSNGTLRADLRVEHGFVASGEVARQGSNPAQISLAGIRFDFSALAARLRDAGWNEQLARETAALLLTA